MHTTIKDFELDAQDRLTKHAWDYYRSGANSMVSLQEAELAFTRLPLKLKAQIAPTNFDSIETEVMGFKLPSPVCVASTAFHRMADTVEGECASAGACNKSKTPFMLSSWATTTAEDVAKVCPDSLKLYQLYLSKNPDVNRDIWRRVRESGFKILALTTDTQQLGKRDADVRNSFQLPSHLSLKNLDLYTQSGQEQSNKLAAKKESGLSEYVKQHKKNDIAWDIIPWIKQESQLKVVAKGVMCYDDAKLAIENGTDGIFVSNHGARQLDTTPATIEVLPEVAQAVEEHRLKTGVKVPVFFDGGVRRGADVFRAVALGADIVFIGRPVLWGLASDGQTGVENVIKIINDELKLVMMQTGCYNIQDIKTKGKKAIYGRDEHLFKL